MPRRKLEPAHGRRYRQLVSLGDLIHALVSPSAH
jgi:hypothetical protein